MSQTAGASQELGEEELSSLGPLSIYKLEVSEKEKWRTLEQRILIMSTFSFLQPRNMVSLTVIVRSWPKLDTIQ